MFAAALILFSLSGFLENTLQRILWPFLLRRFRQLPFLQIMQDFNFSFKIIIIVKLLAKSKLKSLPYNHTDHPPTHLPITLNQVYTSPTSTYEVSLESYTQGLFI